MDRQSRKPGADLQEKLREAKRTADELVALMKLDKGEEKWVREHAIAIHEQITREWIASYPGVRRADLATFAMALAFSAVSAWAEHEDRLRGARGS